MHWDLLMITLPGIKNLSPNLLFLIETRKLYMKMYLVVGFSTEYRQFIFLSLLLSIF